jgi:hypothetical protein
MSIKEKFVSFVVRLYTTIFNGGDGKLSENKPMNEGELDVSLMGGSENTCVLCCGWFDSSCDGAFSLCSTCRKAIADYEQSRDC